MKKILNHYRGVKSLKPFYLMLIGGLLLLAVSIIFNFYANRYTATHYSNGINDLILDHIPTVNVEFIFLEGILFFIAFVILLGLYKPQRFPFMLKTAAVFIIVRAFFIILTHIGPPLHQAAFQPNGILEKWIFGSGEDLFFSGHTGFPFLMALVFWDNKTLRFLLLASAIFFAGTVLFGHLHYSIDVFSAFFISYGVYKISLKLFKKDYKIFHEYLPNI